MGIFLQEEPESKALSGYFTKLFLTYLKIIDIPRLCLGDQVCKDTSKSVFKF